MSCENSRVGSSGASHGASSAISVNTTRIVRPIRPDRVAQALANTARVDRHERTIEAVLLDGGELGGHQASDTRGSR